MKWEFSAVGKNTLKLWNIYTSAVSILWEMLLTVWHIGCRHAAVCYNYEAITIFTYYPKQIR